MIRGAVIASAVLVFAETAQAQPAFEIGYAFSDVSRSGNSLNSGGFPFDEVTGYDTNQTDIRLGYSFGTVASATLNYRDVNTDAPQFVIFPFAPSNDTVASDDLLALQIGTGATGVDYLGVFHASGNVDFTFADLDHNTDFKAYGLEAHHSWGPWTVSGQIGRINSRAVDPETLDNAEFFQLGLSRDIFEKRGRISLYSGRAKGDQDIDSGAGPDRVDLRNYGI